MNHFLLIYKIFLLFSSTGLLSIEVTSTQAGSSYFFYQQPRYPRDCEEALRQCISDNFSGVYTIKPDGYPQPFEVYCNNDVSSGGWTVIQRQIDGSLTFKRNWEDYKNGFGFLSSEFWIGHDKLSYLTNQAIYELRIDMALSNGSSFYVKYNSFRISDEWSDYSLVSIDVFRSNWSCIPSTCPLNTTQGTCTCHDVCADPVKQTDCYVECLETCVPEGCLVTETNSFISIGESFINTDCTQNCTCIGNQLSCTKYECSTDATCRVKDEIRKCYCNEGYEGDGETCIRNSFRDCYDAQQAGHTTDGVYTILPTGWPGGTPFTVFCDMATDGGGWTVFQRRTDGVTDFYRDWNEYKQGFGSRDAGNDFWLGNDKIFYLTNQTEYKLRVDIVTSGGSSRYAEYTSFQIGDEYSKYRMSIGSYSGDAYDNGMDGTNGTSFSTRDQDNDGCDDHNYAEGHRGAWWYDDNTCEPCYDSYRDCVYFETRANCNNAGTYSNLNGVYTGGDGQNIFWSYYYYCNLNSAEMKIRPSSV